MKKLLLFSLIIGFAISAMAQSTMVPKKKLRRVRDGQEVAVKRTNPIPVPELKQGTAVNEDVVPIVVGHAAHQRGIRREEVHVISYNYDLDVISVASILDPATYPNVNDVGVVGMWYSTDHGQTWSDPVILNDDLSQGANYYLSGVMFNPDGNTSVDNMFGVYQGTLNPTSGDWRFKAFGSSTLGGDFLTNYLYEESGYDGYFNWFGLNQYGNEMRCLNMKNTGTWNAFDTFTLQPITGEFNGEGFDWDFSNLIDADLYYDAANTIVAWTGNWQGSDSGIEIAWADDGVIGYMWIVGVSNDEPTGMQPIVWRTGDSGDSWDFIGTLDFQSGDMQDILEPYIIEVPGTSGIMIPRFDETAGVVDANGDLQMMVALTSHSADCITHPDSLNHGWTGEPGNLFLLTVNDDGISDLMWVDSLRTENVLAATEGNYCGTTGWQHRISAAKSQNEMQVFFTWIDTRDSENNQFNTHPDLFGWSMAVCDNAVVMDSTICFSLGSELEESFYFNCGSDKAYFDAGGTYEEFGGTFTIPYLQGVNAIEFLVNTVAHEDPITLSYVTGIEFPDLCITGIEESALADNVTVTQNMPNPFTGSTVIEVSTKSATAVTVEVSNIMGQSIYTVDAGIINGTQKVELSAENLEAGVYFYTVHVGNIRITNKMIVE